jgi:hypothetical protein
MSFAVAESVEWERLRVLLVVRLSTPVGRTMLGASSSAGVIAAATLPAPRSAQIVSVTQRTCRFIARE